MIRRVLVVLTAAVLMVLSVSAQPAPKQPPTEPVERTAADLEAIRQLETEGYRIAESMTPRDISHITFQPRIRVGITPYINSSDWVFNDRKTAEEAKANTGWNLKVADQVRITEAVTENELRILREELDPTGIYLKGAA